MTRGRWTALACATVALAPAAANAAVAPEPMHVIYEKSGNASTCDGSDLNDCRAAAGEYLSRKLGGNPSVFRQYPGYGGLFQSNPDQPSETSRLLPKVHQSELKGLDADEIADLLKARIDDPGRDAQAQRDALARMVFVDEIGNAFRDPKPPKVQKTGTRIGPRIIQHLPWNEVVEWRVPAGSSTPTCSSKPPTTGAQAAESGLVPRECPPQVLRAARRQLGGSTSRDGISGYVMLKSSPPEIEDPCAYMRGGPAEGEPGDVLHYDPEPTYVLGCEVSRAMEILSETPYEGEGGGTYAERVHFYVAPVVVDTMTVGVGPHRTLDASRTQHVRASWRGVFPGLARSGGIWLAMYKGASQPVDANAWILGPPRIQSYLVSHTDQGRATPPIHFVFTKAPNDIKGAKRTCAGESSPMACQWALASIPSNLPFLENGVGAYRTADQADQWANGFAQRFL